MVDWEDGLYFISAYYSYFLLFTHISVSLYLISGIPVPRE